MRPPASHWHSIRCPCVKQLAWRSTDLPIAKQTCSRVVPVLLVAAAVAGAARPARASDQLCDPAVSDCRAPILTLIQNERVEIDVAFWFMEDSRYSAAIINRWNAGVRVRVLLDPRGDAGHPANADIRQQLAAAGIPIRKRTAGGILHWKTMLFAGQNVVQFSGANYSPFEFTPVTPYSNYEDEAIYITDDPDVVNSFKTKWDDLWTDTSSYADYANVPLPRTRQYPTFSIDPELNFPPGQDYANRSVNRYNAETQRIDATMFRITDQRHTNALINAIARGVTVRLITEQEEYRNPSRLWDSWNVDRMYVAGVQIRQRGHAGLIHQKSVILHSQGLTIFGSSNWTTPSANSQQEHNYFTTKPAIFQWFVDQFERKWNNSNPAGATETVPFSPLPPDKPVYVSVPNGATGVSTSGVVLKWDGGPWAHNYDVYFGVSPTPPLFAANQNLGPDDPTRSPKQYQTFALPALTAGTTYYWRIVSKTMANLTAAGPVWSFTTSGTSSCSPGSAPTVVMWMANVAPGALHGNWSMIADSSAAGGSALSNPDHGAAKVSPALANPTNYFDTTFHADAGTAYHLWVRMRAQNNSYANDSIHVQFSDSTDALGTPAMRMGTTSSAEVVLQAGSNGASPQGWGWADNGWDAPGANVYFASSGSHTLRIQQREDGAIVDQVVLSPGTYFCGPPGPRRNDTTILPATESGSGSGSGLPSPWKDTDVGAVPITGSAQYDNGAFTVTGSGADIWGTADAFHFVYQQLTGDFSIQARVASVQQADRWSKAGVMIRATLDRSSAHAVMLVWAAKGVAMQWRPSNGAASLNAAGSLSTAPRWVRLVRSGGTITGVESANGTTWTTVSTQTIAMASTVYVGLAVTSHATSAASTAVIGSVSLP